MPDQLALALALPPTQGELIIFAIGTVLVLVALLFPLPDPGDPDDQQDHHPR